MKSRLRRVLIGMIAVTFIGASPLAGAAEAREELLVLKNTIVNLVDALVAEGVISAEKAHTLKTDAAAKAKLDAAKSPPVVDEPLAEGAPKPSQVVRVPYVPEFIKEEIREKVRADLRADVTEDVVTRAKEERWGVKDALPEWVNAMNWYGNIRLREQSDFYAADNLPNSYPNFNAINDAGGIPRAGANTFLNSTENQDRLRFRLRFGFEATIAENVLLNVRLATGNEINPVSLNQTLGRSGQLNPIFVDRASLGWALFEAHDYNWLTVMGGRLNKPFFGTELVWDDDLAFEGVATSVHVPVSTIVDLISETPWSDKTNLSATIGAFPVLENELPVPDNSSNDKWLLGGQFLFDHAFQDDSIFKIGVAYYDYINIFGRRNEFGSTLTDWTAPDFLQKGNTVYDIRNDNDLTTELFALASDFTLANLTASFDYAGFGATHVILTSDIVKNIGFDGKAIERRTGAKIDERSLGYSVGLRVGRPTVANKGEWALFSSYRYLQRDAVLDAFADSSFHLGGTDTKGYVIGGELGLLRNTWLRLRWLSADEIDGAPLGIDVLQADVNARF